MSPIKSLEFHIIWSNPSLGIFFCFEDNPMLFSVTIGPIYFSINKPKYWKNGMI